MDPISQPSLAEELHDEFQGAELRLRSPIERLWLGERRGSVVRMLSLREVLSSMEAVWGSRAGQELGEYILRFISEPPARSEHGRDLLQLCSAMIDAELPGFARFVRCGEYPEGASGIVARIRGETSDLHLLVYFKMLEHLAISSSDERIWRAAMMLMSDASTVGDDPLRQELASLCLERVMLVEGRRCGHIAQSEAMRPESGIYPELGDSGIVPSSMESGLAAAGGDGSSRMHEEKFDFARACIAESMFLATPQIQMLNVNALALGQHRGAIGPLLALCMGIRLRGSDPDKTPTGFEQAHLRSLILQHLSQAHPLAGGDSDTLPAIADHLQRTALLLMDPDRTIPSHLTGDSLSFTALDLAHGELSRLLDPKQILYPHPSYAYDGRVGTLIPRFPHGGLQQSAIVSAAELALNGYKPAASTVLRAMLELTGRYLPLTLTREKPPRQIRESLGILEMCIESLALAGIPGAKTIPPVFIRGDSRLSQLLEDQINELAVPSLELIRLQASLVGSLDARLPLHLAARVIEADVEICAICTGAKPPDVFRDLMRKRDEAFGGKWDSFELPDTSLIAPLLRRMDERRMPREKPATLPRGEPVFLLTRRK